MTVIACSTLAFSRQPLESAVARIAELGFDYVDLAAAEGWAHLDPSALARGAARTAERVSSLLARHGLSAIGLNASLGTCPPGEAQRRARGLFELARALSVRTVTLQAPARGTAIEDAAAELEPLAAAARGLDVSLTVETHIGTVTELPESAVDLVEAVEGLGLTLDPSHYYAGPAQGTGLELVYPYVRHVHVRDAGRSPEELQVELGCGVVDFREILAGLQRHDYEGAISVEYIDTHAEGAVEEHIERARRFLADELAALAYPSNGC